VMALEVLKTAEGKLDAARADVNTAVAKVAGFLGEDPAERARLELARDEELRKLQAEEKRYQIAKDLSDNITIGYNTSEVVMARLVQTTNAKERIYAQSVSFFGTNEIVLTALTASFTGMHGLHESTQTLEAMKDGVNKSLEVLADIGSEVQEAATKSGYGPTVSAAS
ncbi:MAG: cell surface protein, partial [Pseudomonadota bacterium]